MLQVSKRGEAFEILSVDGQASEMPEPGEQIVTIEGKHAVDLTLADFVRLDAGPENTLVALLVRDEAGPSRASVSAARGHILGGEPHKGGLPSAKMEVEMDVRWAICATIGAVVLPGCSCDPGYEKFELSEDVTVAELNEWLNAGDTGAPTTGSSDDCEWVCAQVFGADEDNDTRNIHTTSSCTLTLEEAATGDDAVGGHVECAGEVTTNSCEGRRPLGIHAACVPDGEQLGVTLAMMAHLEAASVLAFQQLAEQLERWGAPEALAARCRQAADDERRHAAIVGALARSCGVEPPPVECDLHAEHTLAEAALHNAVEGCVYETWAALVAHHRARMAQAAPLREAFATIAEDETRHAQLAWDIHAWFASQLGDEAAVIDAARAEALRALPSFALAQAHTQHPVLGAPDPARARAMAGTFAHNLGLAA